MDNHGQTWINLMEMDGNGWFGGTRIFGNLQMDLLNKPTLPLYDLALASVPSEPSREHCIATRGAATLPTKVMSALHKSGAKSLPRSSGTKMQQNAAACQVLFLSVSYQTESNYQTWPWHCKNRNQSIWSFIIVYHHFPILPPFKWSLCSTP